MLWLTGQRQFRGHCPAPGVPLQSLRDHGVAAEERGGGPGGHHGHGGTATALRRCQGGPALTPPAPGTQPKVRNAAADMYMFYFFHSPIVFYIFHSASSQLCAVASFYLWCLWKAL